MIRLVDFEQSTNNNGTVIVSTPLKETSLVLIYFYIELFESKYILHFSVMHPIHKSGGN